MIKVAGTIALSIFLTCTLFFVIYGLSYVGMMWSIKLIKKIKNKIKEESSEPDVENIENFKSSVSRKSFY